MRVPDTKSGQKSNSGPGIADRQKIFSSLLALVEAFYPSFRIPPKVRFGVEEIMERVILRRTLQPARRI